MHVLLLLATAFTIWMLVDAIQRSAEFYWYLIIIFVPFGTWVYFFMVKMHDFQFVGPLGFSSERKCATCRHCVTMFEDGVRCGVGHGEPIFRTNVHVDYCTLYERR